MGSRVSDRPTFDQVACAIDDAVKRIGGVRFLLGHGHVSEADVSLVQLVNQLVDLRNEVAQDESCWTVWPDSYPARRRVDM